MSIASETDLRGLYREPSRVVANKVIDRIDPHSRRFIELSPFCCIGTADAEGRGDVSPRGDVPGFVRVLDERRLFVPDRPGNNRVDSMRNLLENPRLGMLFLIPGIFDVLRVNGRAEIVRDSELLEASAVDGKVPKTGLVVHVEEVFLHCGRAVKRARLWEQDAQRDRSELPKLAEMIRGQLESCDPALDEQLDALAEERYMNELY
jgi:uncharacterized protein